MIYELHVGTFTPGATLDSAIERLDHLVDLGISHVELLPLNAFNGIWNWGYDGVAWYAVHEPYGGPDALKRFVDACHARGLAVILDVVYNHLGPSGNYLPRFGPYLKSGRNTWGDLVNLDGEGSAEVRRYILDNALTWLRDFHIDGLRLDAVHALQDSSPTHLLEQLAVEVAELSGTLGRPLPLIAESDLNDPKLITPRGRRFARRRRRRCRRLRAGRPVGRRRAPRAARAADRRAARLLRRLRLAGVPGQGVHPGVLPRRQLLLLPGPRRWPAGGPRHTPGWRSVVFLQDHDQVGKPGGR